MPVDELAARRVRHLIVLPGGAEDLQSPLAPADPPGLADVSDMPEIVIGSTAAVALPRGAPSPSPATTFKLKLRVITRTVTSPKAPGIPFIVFASVLVSLAVLGLVVLRVMVDQSSFKVGDLDTRVTQQSSELTTLKYAVAQQESPERIAAEAKALGLGPATQVQVLPTPIAPPGAASGGMGGGLAINKGGG